MAKTNVKSIWKQKHGQHLLKTFLGVLKSAASKNGDIFSFTQNPQVLFPGYKDCNLFTSLTFVPSLSAKDLSYWRVSHLHFCIFFYIFFLTRLMNLRHEVTHWSSVFPFSCFHEESAGFSSGRLAAKELFEFDLFITFMTGVRRSCNIFLCYNKWLAMWLAAS